MPNPLAINPLPRQRAITSANDAFTRARLTALFSETAWYPKKKVTIEVAQTKGHAEPPPQGWYSDPLLPDPTSGSQVFRSQSGPRPCPYFGP